MIQDGGEVIARYISGVKNTSREKNSKNKKVSNLKEKW
jgi:hypothetical protein